MELRPYQADAYNALLDWWKVHERHGENPLIVLPTGGGKTIVFCKVIESFIKQYDGVRILVLAHRKELISQAEEKLLTVWPGAPVAVYAASLGRRELNTITIASRDTVVNALDDIGAFDLIIVDEAHNIAPGENTRYQLIIKSLTDRNPHLHVIGFSATPYRTGQGFIYGQDQLFADIAYEAKIKPLIDAGYLCKVTAKAVDHDAVADTSSVSVSRGDFSTGQLNEVVTDEGLIAAAVSEWKRLAYDQGRRATVFFCVSVLHAKLVSEELAELGYDVPVIHGGTSPLQRDMITADFSAGKYIGAANVGIYTEGTDIPRIDCIALLRPTKSLGLYMQMVGRGLRNHEDKKNTLVLDFGGNIERFGPIDTARPESRKRKKDERTKVCPQCDEVVGIFKRKCPCGHEFEPPAFKLCEGCGTENPTAAAKCIACGKPFVNHDKQAANGGILSDEERIKTFPVEEVYCRAMVSKQNNPYLKVIYRSSLFEHFNENLMLGHPGRIGDKAAARWRQLVKPEVPMPAEPEEAAEWAKAWPIFKPVASIDIDLASKYKDIVNVTYGVQE